MGKNIIRRTGIIMVLSGGIFILGAVIYSGHSEIMSRIFSGHLSAKERTPLVVIDAGHGGFDAGKIGTGGTKEKEINLQVSLKIQRNLERLGIRTEMTRTDDGGLYDETSENKKKEDMKARVDKINASGAMLAVSIHQNSFTDSRYSGAQVFYYKGSREGETLAKLIQNSLISRVQPENTRQIKENNDYYILKNSRIPVVIAECGFLSNPEEEALLMQDEYQEKIAWAVTIGILQYIELQNAG